MTRPGRGARVGPETSREEPEPTARRQRAYDAFISYSRTADGRLGPALQRGLQRFAKPWYRLRALRVFRDDASLSANPDLWGSIQRALDDSEYFILLASPAAAESLWVAKEAEYWLERRGTEQMLVVLTEGDLFWNAGSGVDRTRTSALPAPLGDAFAEEPRYVDLRWARTDAQLAERDARFRDGLADLAAPIHGRSKDEMLGEDVRQHKRTLAVAWSAASLLAALAIGASVLAVLAVQARDRARTQANIALARQLAAESAAQLEGPSAVSPLLALESYRRVRTQPPERSYDARNAMVDALQRSPRLLATLPASGLRDASFSPDGKTLATGGNDGSVRFWDARDGHPLGPSRAGSGSGVRAMAFSPNGNTVAVGDDKGRVTLWDVDGQSQRGAIRRATRWITLIVFRPDGRKVAVIGSDEAFGPDRVRVWDLRDLRRRPRLLGEDTGIGDAAFTADGSALLTTNHVGGVKLWTGRGSRTVHGDEGYRLVTGRAGRVLLLAKVGGGSRIVDALTGKPVGPRLPVSGEFFFDVATGGHTFASGESGSALGLWNVQGTKLVGATLPAGQGRYATPVFGPDGAELASVGEDGTVKLWDARDATPLARESFPAPRGRAFAEAASTVALGPHGRAAAGDSTSVTFWDRAGSTGTRRPSTWGAESLAFSPDGRRLASGGTNGGITFWDTARHRRLASPPSPHQGSVWGLAFSADGKELTSRSADGVVAVWNTSQGKPTLKSRTKVALPPGCTGGEFSGKYESCPEALTSVAFAPDGTLVYGTAGAGVRFWDPATRSSLGELGTAAATGVALAPDGLTLATVTGDAVRLWDVSRRQPLGRPLPDPAGIAGVAFGGDGTELATGGAHGTVTRWDRLLLSTDFDAWRTRLCRLAGRNLTKAEWAQFLPGAPYRTTCPGLR